jgi:hypothetical protein
MNRMVDRLDRALYPRQSSNWDDCISRDRVLSNLSPEAIILDIGAGAGIVQQVNFKGMVAKVSSLDAHPAHERDDMSSPTSCPFLRSSRVKARGAGSDPWGEDGGGVRGRPRTPGGFLRWQGAERQNLNFRVDNRRMTRSRNSFSKKAENDAHMMASYFMHYNFVRIHQNLRAAMAAKVTAKLWEMSDMVKVLEDWEASRDAA